MSASVTSSNPSGGNSFPFQFRLPKKSNGGKPGDVDPWFGGNRSFWNALVLPTDRNGYKPPVKSIVVRIGRERGRRFIIFESAKQYFDKVRQEQEAA